VTFLPMQARGGLWRVSTVGWHGPSSNGEFCLDGYEESPKMVSVIW